MGLRSNIPSWISYRNVDEEKLHRNATASLANYGASCTPHVIVGSRGSYYYTASGRQILDWTSGQMSSSLGHGNREIVEVITNHASHLDHVYSGLLTPPLLRLAERLTSVLPPGLDRVFFPSTGSEANEAAIKLAKTFTGKFEIVGLAGSWHGMLREAQSVQYVEGRKGHGPNIPGHLMLPQPNAYRSPFRQKDGLYDWRTELDYGWELIDQHSSGSLAACVVECIQGDGGIIEMPPGYLKALKEHCQRRNMLLIIDEAQTGFGRTGSMFAFQHEEVIPDILTLAKPLGNGLPLSAVVMSLEIDDVCRQRGFFFYTSHMNDPLPAAVGDKVLELLIRDNLVERANTLGGQLFRGLRRLKERYGCIGDVRGRGLMAGVEVISECDSETSGSELGKELGDKMMELGLWVNVQPQRHSNSVLRIGPPLTSTEQEIKEGLQIMERALSSTNSTMPFATQAKL